MAVDESIENFIRRFERVYFDPKEPDMPLRPPENKQSIERYIRQDENNKRSIETIKNKYEAMTILSKWCSIPFSRLTDFDIEDFLHFLVNYTYIRNGESHLYSPYTIQQYKIVYKQFFRSKYFQNENKNAIIDSIEIMRASELEKKASRAREKEILTEEDIERLIDACGDSARDKMLISVLYESGCRKGELRNCIVSDAKVNSQYCHLRLYGKTGERFVDLVYARKYIQDWIKAHPLKLKNGGTDPNAPLLVTVNLRDGVYKKITESGIDKHIKKIAARAGIEKPVNPHNFRKSRMTHLANDPHWSDQKIKHYAGWTKDSNMLKHYVKNVETRDAALSMYGLENEETKRNTKLRIVICPRCHVTCPSTQDRCACGMPLTEDTRAEDEYYFQQSLQAERSEMRRFLENEMQLEMDEIARMRRQLVDVLNVISKSNELTEEEKKNLPEW